MRAGVLAAGALVLVATGTVRGSSARAARGPSAPLRPAARALADELRRLYEAPGAPWERWGRRGSAVELGDGTRAPRDEAYRDRPEFVPAGALLLRGEGDDALLGAWLLGTAPPRETDAAASALIPALRGEDPRVRFFAAHQLGRLAVAPARPALVPLALTGGPAESGVAHWALRRIAAGLGRAAPPVPPGPDPAFASDFCRGVSWWQEEDRGDGGRASFGALADLGVNWISIHTWDPMQRGVHSPDWAAPRRPLVIQNLPELVRNAHAAGLKVMVKPHLEMRGYEPTGEERRILRGSDEEARRTLFERFHAEREGRPRVWHNDIEMKTEDDWRAWFSRYEEYLLSYVRQAAEAQADAFCVGRETDKTAIAREGDWRRLIARVRQGFKGPLTYSANFDGYDRIPFWDALDVIGISAYFPLASGEAPPSASDLAAALGGGDDASARVLAPDEPAGGLHRDRLSGPGHGGATALGGERRSRRRVAAGAALRGRAPGRLPAAFPGRLLLLALGRDVAAALPRLVLLHPGQAGRLRHGALLSAVRKGAGPMTGRRLRI